MYTDINYKTKKALKEAVISGKRVGVYQPNNMFNTPDPRNTVVNVEGPHYPAAHSWYARCTLDENGYITKVK